MLTLMEKATIPSPRVERAPFGTGPNGEGIELFTLSNARGMKVRFTGYGGIITSIEVPDRASVPANVVLGYDTLDGYLWGDPYVGTLIGRYANRIAHGRFTLAGREHRLPRNDGPNHLHGGAGGFHRKVWTVEPFERGNAAGATLRYTSPAGEEGYPATLRTRVTYMLTDANAFAIDYHATADAPTPVNLTSHIYFNLTGDPQRDILGHELVLNASRFLPVNPTQIPTGEIASVANTPFDFRSSGPVGERIDEDDEQLRHGGQGYDHNWVLDRGGPGLAAAARLFDPESGRVVEVATTEPGIHVYTGFRFRRGIALETQHFPDSPNRPAFPATTLRPGERYRSRTVFTFSLEPAGVQSTRLPSADARDARFGSGS